MAENHVAANLLMIVLVIGGLIIGLSVKQEVFPEITMDRIQVSIVYPGAGPEEIEEGILLTVEDNLTAVEGIRQITSTASEGVGTVIAELYPGNDPDTLLQEIKSEVDRITTFPQNAEKPIISKVDNKREVISLVIFGDVSELSLREQAEQIRDELLQIEGITQVDLGGVRPYEIAIEISEANLRRYRLTLDQVAERVRMASIDLPGGTIKTSDNEILIRTKEKRYYAEGYQEIRLLSQADGREIRLGDIADIRDTFEETDLYARFDGKPAAMIKVYRIGDQKPTEISEEVLDYIKEKKPQMPTSIQLADWNDTSELFQSRMKLLLKNAALGLVMVMVVLGLFLEIKLALWVMLGIPISFLGSMLLMPVMDVSLNMISLFAFIMALGIVVDDAIVVGENIYEHRQMGKPYLKAARDGALEVARPVVFAILTSVAAFLPLVYVSGTMGKFIRVIPLIVISILIISLVESLFVLPAHLSIGRARKEEDGRPNFIERGRLKFAKGMEKFIAGPYRRTLQLCLEFRYASLALAVAVLLLSFGLVGGGLIKFGFMPKVDGDKITATVEMVQGTPALRSTEVQEKLLKAARATIADLEEKYPDEKLVRHIYSIVGGTIAGGGPGGGRSSTGSNQTAIAILLTPSETRNIGSSLIGKIWRQKVGEITGAESVSFASNLVHMGANIDIQLAHENFDILRKVSEKVRNALTEYPGVNDIASNYSRGKREIKATLTEQARTLGITERSLGQQLRAAFYGSEALRLQRGRNEVKVLTRYPLAERQHLADLENLRIRTPQGGEIPVQQAAVLHEDFGFSTIQRTDRKRVINITADVDSSQANGEEIIADLKMGLLKNLHHDYPGLVINMEGEQRERRDSMGSMRKGFGLAMIAIFALLAIPFRSYSQPLLIMTAIPFGIVGAVAGHLIMGYDLSILSIFGIVALSGVVINDSLLLIDYANSHLQKGQTPFDALLIAGQRRFRPILLTSLTTFFGLAPMLLETSTQAQFLIPMAISLAFGIMFATGITLLLIPALYLILEDIRSLFGLKKHGVNREEEEEKTSVTPV